MTFVRMFVLLALAIVPAVAGAAADPKKNAQGKEPTQIVNETVDKVVQILLDPEYKDEDARPKLREKVRATILSVVDMKSVADLTLANYKSKFSPEQYKDFIDVFSQLLFITYIKHMERYSNEKVVITSTEKVSDTQIRVKTKTVTDTREIPIEYSFKRLGNRWMLYDVHIEGVSLIKNYRSQFRDILIKRTADQFLAQLHDKVKQNEQNL